MSRSHSLSVQSLLRTGMKKLMEIAAEVGSPQPYPQTHVLNVMAAVFLDKVLSNDIQTYVAEGRSRISHHSLSRHAQTTHCARSKESGTKANEQTCYILRFVSYPRHMRSIRLTVRFMESVCC